MNIQVFCGDCNEILPTLPSGSVDAVITDPPYAGLKGGISHSSPKAAKTARETTTVGSLWGDDLAALREFARVAKYGAIVFCSWHRLAEVRPLLGGETVGLVTWYKRNSQPTFRNRPHYSCEYAWLIEYAPGMNWKALKTFYDIPGLPAGCFASERILAPGTKKAAHPTQKPLQLMSELVQAAGATVVDPYMGTGTTGVVCAKSGRNFIGIEKDPGYFEIAQERIAKAKELAS